MNPDTTHPPNSVPWPEETPVLPVPVAGAVLGLGRSAAYLAANRGDLPTVRVGRRVVVPTARLRELLGMPTSPERAAQ